MGVEKVDKEEEAEEEEHGDGGPNLPTSAQHHLIPRTSCALRRLDVAVFLGA